jgi:hypothetical protein
MPRTAPLVGYHCSHEQQPPSALPTLAQSAADAGCGAAMCSDHFHPWSERQGHSGFGRSMMSFGTVCAPGQRDHPAVVARASATFAEMFLDRFWLALGRGEALNESITAVAGPPRVYGTPASSRQHGSSGRICTTWPAITSGRFSAPLAPTCCRRSRLRNTDASLSSSSPRYMSPRVHT